MTLSDYLKREGLTLDVFGQRTQLSAATISRLCRGINMPDWTTVHVIHEATAGEVTANDWMIKPATDAGTSEESAA